MKTVFQFLSATFCRFGWHVFPHEWSARVVYRNPDAVEVWRECRQCGVRQGNIEDDHPILDEAIEWRLWLI